MRVLMVCLGNICRSPLAEGIFREKVKNWPELPYVDSAGTGGWHAGEKPDKRSIAIAARFGVDISAQRARKFNPEDFDAFDYIFAMDQSNQKDLLSLAQEDQKDKVHLLLEFAGLGVKDVPDPWFGDERDFESIYHLLNEALESVENRLKNSV